MSTPRRSAGPYLAYVMDRLIGDAAPAGTNAAELVAVYERRALAHEELSAGDPNPDTAELGLLLADRYRTRAEALRRRVEGGGR